MVAWAAIAKMVDEKKKNLANSFAQGAQTMSQFALNAPVSSSPQPIQAPTVQTQNQGGLFSKLVNAIPQKQEAQPVQAPNFLKDSSAYVPNTDFANKISNMANNIDDDLYKRIMG